MKGVILMAAYVSVQSRFIVPSHICQSPMLFALLYHHTTTEACFCICCRWKSGWSLSSLGLRTRHPFFPETSWNVDSSDHSTHFHCLFKRFKLHFLMQRQTVVNDSGFLKYSWTHVLLTPQHDSFLCSAIWGLKGHAHSPEVSCLALHVLRFLWNSLNLFTILCMVVVKRHKFFAILHWEMWFLVYLTPLSWNLAQSDEPWSSFACKDWDAPFIPKHDTLTYYQCTYLLWTVSKQFNLDIL